ncbi:MAG: lysozyme inhibitor LprI family protein [Pyrinomonadaceae bacterium]
MRKSFVATLVICCSIFALSATGQQKRQKKRKSAAPCANAMTQADMNRCFCTQYTKADEELNRVYQQVLATNRDEQKFIEKLKEAQRAWVSFRDAHMLSLYPETDDPQAAYGTVYRMCYCMNQTVLTVERTKQLKKMLNPVEGDVCN